MNHTPLFLRSQSTAETWLALIAALGNLLRLLFRGRLSKEEKESANLTLTELEIATVATLMPAILQFSAALQRPETKANVTPHDPPARAGRAMRPPAPALHISKHIAALLAAHDLSLETKAPAPSVYRAKALPRQKISPLEKIFRRASALQHALLAPETVAARLARRLGRAYDDAKIARLLPLSDEMLDAALNTAFHNEWPGDVASNPPEGPP
jgi:hypothetical protein